MTPTPTAVRAPAATRRVRPLVGLLVGHTASLTGTMLTLVALPLYVLDRTGSATATGVTGFFATLPVVVGGALGGVVVDRVGHRRASIIADLGGALAIGAVPVLDAVSEASGASGLPFWALLALVFTAGLLDTPGQTARNALLPEAAAQAGMPLERAVGWYAAADRGSRLVGAPLAGLLVWLLGPLHVLALDAVSFAVSALLVARFVPAGGPAGATGAEGAGGYGRQLVTGFRFITADPLLRALVLLVVVTNLFDAAKYSVILPVYARTELGGSVAIGLLLGASGGGALVGALVFGAVGHRLPRRPTFTISFLVAGGPLYAAYATHLPLAALIALTAVAGFAAGALNPIIELVKLERVPLELRARVAGLMNAACWSAMPIGALAAGLALARVGLTATLVVVGSLYVAVTLAPLTGGAWRLLDRPAEP